MATRELSPYLVSPSRVQALGECGLKFDMRYVQGLKPPRMSSRFLFGNVLHDARQHWALDHRLDMVQLMKQAWWAEAEKDVALKAFLLAYEKLSLQARSTLDEIVRRRPELKAPRQSKDWQESAIAKEIAALCESVADGVAGSVWAFSKSDPLPSLYDESLVLAARYQRKWKHLPEASYVELGFTVEWNGFTISGKIDEISQWRDRLTGEPFIAIIDAKTYREHPFAPKNIDQGVSYKVALPQLVAQLDLQLDLEVEIRFGIDAMRLFEYRWFGIDERNERRYLRELQMYARAVEAGAFLSNAARCDADLCGFRGMCIDYHGVPELTEMNEWFNE